MPTDPPTKLKPMGQRAPVPISEAEQRQRQEEFANRTPIGEMTEPNIVATKGHVSASRSRVDATTRSTESTLASINQSRDALEASAKRLGKPPSKLGAEKLTPEEQRPKPAGKKAEALSPAEQRRRFEELSRELGTDNGETLDRVFGKIVPPKTVLSDQTK